MNIEPVISQVAVGKFPCIALGNATWHPLRVRSAHTVFSGLPPLYINKPIRKFPKPPKELIPKTAIEKVMFAIRCVVPGVSTAKLMEWTRVRLTKPVSTPSKIGHESELADAVLDASDKKELKNVTKLAAERDEEQGPGVVATKMAAGSKYLEVLGMPVGKWKPELLAKAVEAAAPSLLTVDFIAVANRKALATLLPRGGALPGCNIQLIDGRKKCTVFYPGVVPGSRSRTWGKHFTKIAVIKHSLRWAWDMHSKTYPEARPYKL